MRDGELANVALELQTHAADYEIIIEQPTSPHPLPTRLKRERDEPGSLPKRAIQAFPISTCVLEFTQDQIEHLSEGKPFVEWMINENLLASPSSCTGCHYNTLHLEDSSHFAGTLHFSFLSVL